MKKRFTAIFLALALCVGLAVPAFAADDEAKEQMKTAILTHTIDGHDFESFEGIDVASPWKLTYPDYDGEYDEVNETWEEIVEGYNGYYAIRQNTVFTVTNTAPANQNNFIRVYISFYEKSSNGTYWDDQYPHSSYLTRSGEIISDYMRPDDFGGLVEVKPGESFKFKLGSDGDVIYKVSLWKWDMDHAQTVTDEWGNSYEEAPYYYKWAMFKVDNTAVDSYMARLNATGFFDVPAGKWYTDAVTWANEKNITNGTGNGKFSPAQQCTHAQILTFLYRAAQNQGTADPGDMAKAVEWAKAKGMIDGSYVGGRFCTRADAVNYIWQAFGKKDAKASGFTDVPAGAGYAKAVDWAVANGITNGTNDAQTEFSPNRVCDRGTIVTFLHRAYVPEARLK